MAEQDSAPMRSRKKIGAVLALASPAALLVLALLTFLNRLNWIGAKRYPADYDSFYYLEEFRSFAESGDGFYRQGFQSYFFLMTALAKTFSLNPVQTFNVSVSLSLLLFSAGLFLVVSAKCRPWIAALLMLCASQSEPLFFLFYGYLRQALGIALVVFSYGLVARVHGSPQNFRRLFLPVFLSALGISMHKFSFFFGVLVAALWFSDSIISKRHSAVIWTLVVLGAALLIFVFKNQLALESDLPWEWERRLAWLSPLELFQYRAYALLAAAGALTAWRLRAGSHAFAGLLLLWLVCYAPIWRHGGVCHRWVISGVPVLFFMLAIFLRDGGSRFMIPRPAGVATAAFLCFLAVLPVLFRSSPRPVGPGAPPELLETYQKELSAWIPEDAMLVAPHGIQFRTHYFFAAASKEAAGRKSFRPNLPCSPEKYKRPRLRNPGSRPRHPEGCSLRAVGSPLDHRQDRRDFLVLNCRW